MQKLSIQELAMYIGCEIECGSDFKFQWNRSIGTPHSHTSSLVYKKKGERILLDIQILNEISLCENEVKPLLRPLSSMTEEEAIEILKMLLSLEEVQGKVEVANDEFLIIKYYGGKSKLVPTDIIEIDSSFNITDEYGHFCNMANIFKYLLSKGFDIFGYIEKGLADSTKINENAE